MFTGIITELGEIRSISSSEADVFRLEILLQTPQTRPLELGASVACAGVCLTVKDYNNEGFIADVSRETCEKTTITQWKPGDQINIERSLRLGDEFGGHLVFGHVDGVAQISQIHYHPDSLECWVSIPPAFLPLVAVKGSVCLNGTSLTINGIEDECVMICLVPHTCHVTTWKHVYEGEKINFEVDMLARYVSRFLEKQ